MFAVNLHSYEALLHSFATSTYFRQLLHSTLTADTSILPENNQLSTECTRRRVPSIFQAEVRILVSVRQRALSGLSTFTLQVTAAALMKEGCGEPSVPNFCCTLLFHLLILLIVFAAEIFRTNFNKLSTNSWTRKAEGYIFLSWKSR